MHVTEAGKLKYTVCFPDNSPLGGLSRDPDSFLADRHLATPPLIKENPAGDRQGRNRMNERTPLLRHPPVLS